MDYLQSLIRDADSLRRRLWATSQTSAQKFDNLLSALIATDDDVVAGSSAEAGLGHTFAVMFLLAGVHGMKPINGEDALTWVAAWKEKNHGAWKSMFDKLMADRSLPRAYGSDIAGPIIAEAMRMRRQAADDLLMDVMVKFIHGAGEHIKASSLQEAIGYVQKAIKNLALNRIERQDKREQSLTFDDEEGNPKLEKEVADAHSLDALEEDHRTFEDIYEAIETDPKLRAALEKVHRDAMTYFKLVEQGHSEKAILNTENPKPGSKEGPIILGPSLLPHPFTSTGIRLYPSSWSTMKANMLKILKAYFAHQREEHEHHMHQASQDPWSVYAA